MADKVAATYHGTDHCRAGGGERGYCQLAPGHPGELHVFGRPPTYDGEGDEPP